MRSFCREILGLFRFSRWSSRRAGVVESEEQTGMSPLGDLCVGVREGGFLGPFLFSRLDSSAWFVSVTLKNGVRNETRGMNACWAHRCKEEHKSYPLRRTWMDRIFSVNDI